MDFKKLNARYNESKQYKDRWLDLYKDLYRYVIPDRNAFNTKFNYSDDGNPVTAQIWDNTAMLCAYQRAYDLHGLLMPQDRKWGQYVMDPHIFKPEVIAASQPIIDEMNENIFFYLNQSNLSRAVSSSNLDLIGGTAGLWIESIDDDTPLYFRSIPAVALYIEYSTDDVVNTCWYQCKMSGRDIIDTFDYTGKQRGQLEQSPDEKFIVIYGQIKYAENKFFIYAVLENDPFTPLFAVDRSYKQALIYRDRVRPGESDGRGIGVDLLPTICDLNRVVEYSRKSLAFKAYPPMFYDSNAYINPYAIRQWAGAMIARSPQSRNPIEAMETPNSPETLEHIKDLREVIRDGFQVDPLGEINTPVRSATEVSIRENRAQRTSSTDISRLINELPKEVYEVATKILGERRLLMRNRADLKNFNIKKLKFDFQSPLFDLQKQDDINHFVGNLQIKQQFFGEGAAIATVDIGEANDFLTKSFNLPSKLFLTKDKLTALVKQMSAAAAQQNLPQPSTGASPVQLPQQSSVGI